MVQVYLFFNATLYLLLSTWVLLKPIGTAKYVGYHFLNNSGKVEYLAVYGGLELGLAVFLAIAGFVPVIRFSGLVFCVCIYAGSILVRTSFALYYGNITRETYMLGGLEYVLGIWGAVLLFIHLNKI